MTVSVTGTTTGELNTPAVVSVIVPLKTPIGRPEVLNEAVTVLLVLPDDGETESQLPPGGVVTAAAVVKAIALPDPPLLTVIAISAGFAPPTAPVADILDTDVDSNGGSTVIVTGITSGDEPAACAAVIVTFPL